MILGSSHLLELQVRRPPFFEVDSAVNSIF